MSGNSTRRVAEQDHMSVQSPFALPQTVPLNPDKFRHPDVTAKGEARAQVAMAGLTTLWFNTGTLCNLACKSCYIDSSPTNDALVYLTLEEVQQFLDEIAREGLPTQEIAFTGGEPFMNPDMVAMIDLSLERGFDVLVLTNAMRPMRRFEAQLLALADKDRLTFRVSLDHHSQAVHEEERGSNSWLKALDGIGWLAGNGFKIAIAGRHLPQESDEDAQSGYGALFAEQKWGISPDSPALVLFPEMDALADVPEITTACWDILDVAPQSMMCASSRMVVRRKGEEAPRVAACTLLPYDPQFDMGATLAEASGSVKLNHPHCARFCVLGGASCSG
jgi:uncharacterized Fe-S cluster-containing radical SAM superfamily protein